MMGRRGQDFRGRARPAECANHVCQGAQPPIPQSSQERMLTTSQSLCLPRSLCLSQEAGTVVSAEAPPDRVCLQGHSPITERIQFGQGISGLFCQWAW